MKSHRTVAGTLLTALVATVAVPVAAQEVTLTSRMSTSFGGALNVVSNLAASLGGASMESTETQYHQGSEDADRLERELFLDH